jgi:dTDP-4-dehydrorhamnose 3,5-epimerase
MPMRFVPTALPGVTLIEPETIGDDRGHFARLYCPDEFARAGIKFVPTQTSLSFNRALHTLRIASHSVGAGSSSIGLIPTARLQR